MVEDFTLEAPKTKDFINIAKNLKVDGKKLLLVLADRNNNVNLSARNVPDARVITASDINTYAIMRSNAIVLSESSVDVINKL